MTTASLRDPRVIVSGKRVNAKLSRAAIRHAVMIERWKKTEVNDLVKFLDRRLVPSLISKAKAMQNSPKRDTVRVRAYLQAVNEILRSGLREASGNLKTTMSNLAVSEAEWQKAITEDILPISVDFVIPSVGWLKQLSSEPIRGKVMDDWFRSISDYAVTKIDQSIKLGLANGDSVDTIAKTLMQSDVAEHVGVMRNAASLVRTAANEISTTAREATYVENSDIIKEVVIVATLDLRTTEICMGMDGKVYPVGEGPRPPFHWGCRTTTAPVTKSWKELGLSGKEAAGARASMDGEVPDKVTYPEWLRDQPNKFQDEALGKDKAELFRQGVLDFPSFKSSDVLPASFSELVEDKPRRRRK